MGPLGRANLSEACAGLLAARQRTALALIGIVIGVASVSSMISVGAIVRDEAALQFEELGTDIVDIRLRTRDRTKGRVSLSLADAQGVVSLSSLRAAAPYTLDASRVVLGGVLTSNVSVVGATEALADLNRLRVVQGRFVSRLDAGRHFCVVGSGVAAELRRALPGPVVGRTVRIGEIGHTVVGELERAAIGRRAFEPDRAVIVPLATARRVTPKATLRDIVARMAPGAYHLEAAGEVADYFRLRAPLARSTVRSAEELIEQMHRQMRLYTLLLGTVGGISLLVGGIGVMNVMLVAVSERKVEIGLRRALGARRRDIQSQFLAEALILALAGGVLGAALAVAATFAICHFTGWAFAVSAGGTMLGTLVAGASGVFFGFYPAHQASRLDPVAALQGR